MARMVKRLKENYTVVNNKILSNKELSIEARGLLITLISLPDTWDFSIKGLGKILPDGRTKLQKNVDFLVNAGYITKLDQRRNRGRFGTGVWIITDDPNSMSEYLENPENAESAPCAQTTQAVNPSAETTSSQNPSAVFHTQSNKHEENTNEIKTTQSTAGCKDDVVVDEVCFLLKPYGIDTRTAKKLLNLAGGDIDRVKTALATADSCRTKIDNIVGFLMAAIKNNYRALPLQHKTEPQGDFYKFSRREYNWNEIKKGIM